MENPRPEKVAVVDEVRERFESSDAALITEYRGLNVAAMAELRRSLRAAGGDYKIYKNTLVRLALQGRDVEVGELLTGPTAIAFVPRGEDGRAGDAAAVAKALKEYGKTNEALIVKGGLLGDNVLDASQVQALADLPSREVLLAQLAGALQAPLTKTAQLLNALPQKFAYALSALIEAGGAPGAPAPTTPAESSAESPAVEAPATEASGEQPASAEEATEEAPAAAAATEAESDSAPAEAMAAEPAPADEAPADSD
jgi:large subunit ribosomal protein L10